MHENQATDTLPDLLGAVPAIDSVDLKAPVVFTRQFSLARQGPPQWSEPANHLTKEISRRQIRFAKKCFLKCGFCGLF